MNQADVASLQVSVARIETTLAAWQSNIDRFYSSEMPRLIATIDKLERRIERLDEELGQRDEERVADAAVLHSEIKALRVDANARGKMLDELRAKVDSMSLRGVGGAVGGSGAIVALVELARYLVRGEL